MPLNVKQDTVAYQAYPARTQDPIASYRRGEVLLAVKYPKYRDLYDVPPAGASLQRVFFRQPAGMVWFSDRAELYDLIIYSQSVKSFILNEKGIELSERGFKCFCFADHLNRPVEYLVVDPQEYISFTVDPSLPVSIWELSDAIDDLENLAEVAQMYECSVDSVIFRIRQFNLTSPHRPLYPPQDYMQVLSDAVLERICTPSEAANKIGVSNHQLREWCFWSGK